MPNKSKHAFSIVIPAYNEESRIESSLRMIDRFMLGQEYEILVIDDGSRDNTRSVVHAYSSTRPHITLIESDLNEGKGSAVKRGMKSSRYPVIVMMDADLSTPIDALTELDELIEGADILVGSRLIEGKSRQIDNPLSRKMLRLFSSQIRKVLFNIPIKDTQCGFKIFKREIAEQIVSKSLMSGYGFDLESLIIGHHNGARIIEVPVTWTHKPGSKVRIVRDSIGTMKEWLRIHQNFRRDLY